MNLTLQFTWFIRLQDKKSLNELAFKNKDHHKKVGSLVKCIENESVYLFSSKTSKLMKETSTTFKFFEHLGENP